jgi:hypothetical protein
MRLARENMQIKSGQDDPAVERFSPELAMLSRHSASGRDGEIALTKS